MIFMTSRKSFFLCFAALLMVFGAGSAQAVNYTNTITNGGTINTNDSAIITNPVTAITGNVVDNGALVFWQSGTVTATNLISGTGYVTQAGTGTTVLGASNTYSGGTGIGGGVLSVSSLADGSSSSVGTSYVALYGGTLSYTGLGSQTTTRALWVDYDGGGSLKGGTFDIANAGSSLTWNPTGGAIRYNVTKTGAGTFTLGGVISSNAAIAVNAGTMNLRAANTSSGAVNVNGGTLNVTGSGKLFSTLNTSLANAVTVQNGGTLEIDNWDWNGSLGTLFYDANAIVLNGGTLTYQGTTNSSSGRGFTVGTNGATFNAATAGQTWTLARANPSVNPTYIAVFNGSSTLTGVGNGQMDQFITGSGGLTKNGSGTWTLTGANTYIGGTAVNAGTLAISNSMANGGSSTITVNNGGTLQFKVDNVFGVHTVTALTPIVANAGGTVGIDSGRFDIIGPLSLNGGTLNSLGTNSFTGFALKGTVSVNGGTNGSTISGTGFTLGSAGVTGTTFDVARGGTASGIDLTVSANVFNGANTAWTSPQASTLTKTGAGTMRISGNASYTGGTTVSAGSLAFSGTNNLAGGNFRVGGAGGSSTLSFAGGSTTAATNSYLYAGTLSGDRAVVNAGANLSVGNVNLGTVSGASGALNVTGGTVSQSGGSAWWAFMVGATNGGYGSLRMTGGALNLSEIGIGSVLGGTGAVDLLGGTMTVTNWFTMNRADANNPANVAALNISGGTLNAYTAGNGLGWGAGGYGVVNIGTGGTANFGTNALRLAVFGAANLTNVVTLSSGGVLQSAGVTMNASGTTGGSAILNFNGGTLQATTTTNGFLRGLSGVTVGSAGGIINNAGNWIQIDQNLLAPTGNGLASISLTNGGSGYIGAPVVQISGGGGTGATAIAQIDTNTGSITNILVTSAGSGYTSAPTVTLVGGAASIAASGISVGTNAVSSGGLTFNGTNVTLLTGNNTFGGGITVNGGILQFTSDAQLGNASNGITLNGGQLYNNVSAPVIASTRTITLGSNGGFLMSGWNSNSTYQSSITGSGSLGIAWDGGMVTLAGSNNYTGTTTIGTTNALNWWNNTGANPTLRLGNSNAMTAGGALAFGTSPSNNTATLDLNGFSASVGGLSGASNARITNTASGAATLTLAPSSSNSTYAGTIANGSGAISLVKNGAGTQTLTANNTYTGATTINAGTLMLSNSGSLYNNGTGAGAIAVNNGGTLFFNRQDTFGNADTYNPTAITVNSGGLIQNGAFFNNLFNLTLNGGELRANGGSGSGWGAYELSGTVTVGGTNASLITANTSVNSSNSVLLSRAGTTTFNVANATADAAPDLLVGARLTDANGNVANLLKTGAGTMLLSNNNTYTGTTTVSGGTLMMGVNNAITTNSAVTLTNGGMINLNGTSQTVRSLQVNGSSATQSNGSITTVLGGDGAFAIGASSNNIGSYTLSGGSVTLSNNGNLQVGQFGSGTFTQTGGSVSTASWAVLARYAGSTGVYDISGGSLTQSNLSTRLIVGETGSGTMTISGSGSVTALGGVALGWGGGRGVLNLNGGNLTAASITGANYGGSGTQTLNFNGGTLTATASTNNFISGLTTATIQSGGAILNNAGYNVTIGQILGGSGPATFNGGGITLLAGSNTFAGGITVNNGVLQFTSDAQLGNATNGITLNGGQLYNSNSAPVIGSARTITLGSNGGYFMSGWYSNLVYQSSITGQGGLGIVWDTGTVTLAGSNNYTGTTTIGTTNAPTWYNHTNANPTLRLGNSNAMTAGGALAFGTSPSNNTATLDLNGFSASVGGLSGASNARITNTASGASTLTLAPSNSSSTFAGTIGNGAGVIAMVKNGTGTQTLSGQNTYTGGTVINAGTLAFTTNNALLNNASNGITVNSGGTARFAAYNVIANSQSTVSNSITVNTGGTLLNAGDTYNLLGALNLNGGLVNSAGTNSVNGIGFQLGGPVTVNGGTNTSVISGNGIGLNSTSNPTTVFNVLSGGTTSGVDLLVSGRLVNGSTTNWPTNLVSSLTKTGSGVMMLSNNNTYTGTTTVAGGTLMMGVNNAITTNSAVTLTNGGTINLNGTSQSVRSLQVNGSAVIQSNGSILTVLSGNGAFSIAGASNTSGSYTLSGGTVTVSNSGNFQVGQYGSGTFTQTGGTVNTETWAAIGRFAGSTGVYDISGGSFNQTGSSSRILIGEEGSGTMTISGSGSVTALGGVALGWGGGRGVLNLNGGTLTAASITGANYGGSGTQTLNFNGGTLTATASTNNLISGLTTATIQSGGATINDGGHVVAIAQSFEGSGGLTKAGGGMMTLSGTNSYAGPTTITAGTLQAGSLRSFGSNSAIFLSDVSGATLDLNGFSQSVGSLSGGGIRGGNVTLGLGTLSLGNSGDNATYFGGISGSGGLLKNGSGTQILAGNNTYAGSTVISGGTLQIGNNGTNGTIGIGSVVNDASLSFNRSNGITVTNQISGTGALVQNGTGTLTLSGAKSYTGGTVINAGALLTGGSETLADSGAVTVNSGATFRLGGNETIAALNGAGAANLAANNLTLSSGNFSGALAGSGDLHKTGASAFTLSGTSSSFTGDLYLQNGSVVADSSTALNANNFVLLSSGSTFTANQDLVLGGIDQNGGTINGAGVITAVSTITRSGAINSVLGDVSGYQSGILKIGTGTTTLGAANTYTGTTKVSEGTLVLGGGGALASDSSAQIASGATLNLSNRNQSLKDVKANGTVSGSGLLTVTGTLSGSGTVNADTVVSGTHSPGNSPGIQTFGGNLSYQPGSTMLWQLADNTTSNSPLVYDQVIVGGNLTFNGGTTLQLVFNDAGSLVNWTDSLWTSNQSWTIYQVSGSTVGLDNLTLASYSSLLDAYGNDFGTTLVGSSFNITQDGQNVTLTYTVPEPSTYALFGLGAMALLIVYRRRKAQS